MKIYNFVRQRPVARFYYKGHHSHPIRRTVLVISTSTSYIVGYEVREGSITRKPSLAPIKSYLKKKIATQKQLGLCKHHLPGPELTTLQRTKLTEFVLSGP